MKIGTEVNKQDTKDQPQKKAKLLSDLLKRDQVKENAPENSPTMVDRLTCWHFHC